MVFLPKSRPTLSALLLRLLVRVSCNRETGLFPCLPASGDIADTVESCLLENTGRACLVPFPAHLQKRHNPSA